MITLTLPAGLLPDGTVVRKPTGQKLYVVQRSIKMYGEQRQEIKADAGLVFLIAQGDEQTAITAIREDKPVSLDLSLEEAQECLQRISDNSKAEETRQWFQRIQDAREAQAKPSKPAGFRYDDAEQRGHAGFQADPS